ncbi:AfsR/SARP family transcriptional regulator [Saccharothrix yanglingensis]|uniref:AfsR/SARP family transcriptional regulator n=1 Tax=Saccharothrix yanglingensis TaxID=659496 RepID=UPI0027D2F982|nr:tetratricopeptide repeat protein [Saccharothrix yanglingensis]
MEFKIIGRTRLHIDGNERDLGSAKQRGVLAMLLYAFPGSVQVALMAQVLWPDSAAEQVKRNVQPIISRLRTILRESCGGRVDKGGDAYRLILESPEMIDFHRFRKLAEQARVAVGRGDHAAVRTLLGEALALWDDRPLHELQGNWADHCREQMEHFELRPAKYVLLESLFQLGEHWEVVARAGRLATEAQPNEHSAGLYMRSLKALGRYATAVDFYADFRQRLAEHVGTEPGPELTGIYRAIMREQASTAAPPRQLRRRAKNFIGRDDLLAYLDSRLEGGGRGQVVALDGMPGVGKSELALQWAHRHAHRFPDGNLHLVLRGRGAGTPLAPDDALASLLRSLGAERVPASSEERQEELRRALGTRRMLILLDDAQDVAQVRPVVEAVADCFTIITSRKRLVGLRVRDQADLIRVPPLQPGDSIRLLHDEIGHARSARDLDALHELAWMLAGLPLALQIVAQHIAHRPGVPVAELVDDFRRHDGLGVLGAGPQDDDESVTLHTAFSWSFRDLPEATARMFRLLGLNATAEFSVDAAAALLDEPVDVVVGHLNTLVRANLLEAVNARRFRLHDVLHSYAMRRVRSEEPVVSRRHATTRLLDWYLASSALAARLLDPQASPVPRLSGMSAAAADLTDRADALDWLTRERANLVATVPQAVSRGFHEHAWRLAANFYEAYDRSGQYEDLLVSLQAALESAAFLKNPQALSGTHNDLGMTQYRLGRIAQARDHFSTALRIAQEAGLSEIYAICLHNAAAVHLALGDTATAVKLYREVLDSARESGYRNVEAYAMDQLANAYRKMEQDDLAMAHHYGALEIRRAIGDVRGQAITLTELGRFHHFKAEHEEALERLREAFAVLPLSGDQARTGEALTAVAEVEYDLGRFSDAIGHAAKAVSLCAALGAREHHGRALHVWGHALVATGRLDEASELWVRATEVLDEVAETEVLDEVAEVEVRVLREHLESLEVVRNAIPVPRAPDLTTAPSREVAERHSHGRVQLVRE